MHAFAILAVPPHADGIVVLEGEAERIDAAVAARAIVREPMLAESLAHGELLVLDHRQVAGIRRRRRHRLVPQHVEHPGRSAHRQRARAVREIGQQPGHAEHAPAAAIGGSGDAAELVALHAARCRNAWPGAR